MRPMTETIDRVDIAIYLRRWLIFGGYALGAWSIVQIGYLVFAWGVPDRFFGNTFLRAAHRLSLAMYFISPAPLVIGCWGLQTFQRWAKAVLWTYVALWLAGTFGLYAVSAIDALTESRGLSWQQSASFALGSLDQFVYASVYPIILLLCLRRPEIRDYRPKLRGFAPIIPQQW